MSRAKGTPNKRAITPAPDEWAAIFAASRIARGLTQEAVGNLVGVTAGAIQARECGKADNGMRVWRKWAEALGWEIVLRPKASQDARAAFPATALAGQAPKPAGATSQARQTACGGVGR
ncbi:HTH_XRE domain containing protein [uncultured Caudovirales phage]|uniref:HTH_XRE domain containing protein n=1 Tax=uncultured Caudovirales phage TaxID=2100421 RepID=A0A6J5P3P8_9CAUD|nr:HTH_XRE domain containing protein [uncultured Caudovirales phage]